MAGGGRFWKLRLALYYNIFAKSTQKAKWASDCDKIVVRSRSHDSGVEKGHLVLLAKIFFVEHKKQEMFELVLLFGFFVRL